MKQLVSVKSKKELAAFIDFPHDLYKNDPNYVPELFIAQRDILTDTHPFFKHSSLQLFLAYDGDKIVGRIAAIFNNNHNSFNNVTDGFFGFFDCINDWETAKMLFDAATDWVKERGATKLVGPANPSTNETAGLLIKGFDSPPVVLMTYNPPYYIDLVEKYGLTKQVDLFAYSWKGQHYNDKSLTLLDKLQQRLTRSNIIIRKINLKNFKQEVAALREVYNHAWDKNLGFFPMTNDEFDYIAKDLKLILDPDFAFLAEQDGKIVGFGVAVPDVNQILRTIKRGRLLPTGIFKLLFNKKKIRGIRIMLLGVIDGYRKMGIEACLYGSIIKEYRRKNLDYAEASWTLEHNEMVNRAIEAIGGNQYKTYRIYEKNI
ncbi:hypothetical protein GCM10023149_40050 [Mucilaginibacter gynuensis]|uniref:N-acetyltransferase domain-containing protein n=1 Tax=Mucilaginibacter gynuensis TaxID=1302236 RepID=A0ABP8H2M0_9SPHI